MRDTDMSDLPVTPVCVRANEWKHESSDRHASSNRSLAGRNMWRANMLFIHTQRLCLSPLHSFRSLTFTHIHVVSCLLK